VVTLHFHGQKASALQWAWGPYFLRLQHPERVHPSSCSSSPNLLWCVLIFCVHTFQGCYRCQNWHVDNDAPSPQTVWVYFVKTKLLNGLRQNDGPIGLHQSPPPALACHVNNGNHRQPPTANDSEETTTEWVRMTSNTKRT
jgi:hypothetical protein